MNLNTLKEWGMNFLEDAQKRLSKEGAIPCSLVSICDGQKRMESILIDNDADKDFVKDRLSALSKVSEAIYLISEARIAEVNKGQEKLLPESLKDHEGAYEAIVIWLYVKGNTFILETPYQKVDTNAFNFFCTGWEEAPIGGRFSNPYTEV